MVWLFKIPTRSRSSFCIRFASEIPGWVQLPQLSGCHKQGSPAFLSPGAHKSSVYTLRSLFSVRQHCVRKNSAHALMKNTSLLQRADHYPGLHPMALFAGGVSDLVVAAADQGEAAEVSLFSSSFKLLIFERPFLSVILGVCVGGGAVESAFRGGFCWQASPCSSSWAVQAPMPCCFPAGPRMSALVSSLPLVFTRSRSHPFLCSSTRSKPSSEKVLPSLPAPLPSLVPLLAYRVAAAAPTERTPRGIVGPTLVHSCCSLFLLHPASSSGPLCFCL